LTGIVFFDNFFENLKLFGSMLKNFLTGFLTFRGSSIPLSILFALSLLNSSLSAEKTMKDMMSEKFSEKRDICLVIKSLIQEGKSAREVTKTSIDLGYNPCLVVRCALEGGGSLEEIIVGAALAGVTSDVISRCAINAGARPDTVARILERQSPATTSIVLPGGESGGGFISPSSF
jgi:hypothetical protein